MRFLVDDCARACDAHTLTKYSSYGTRTRVGIVLLSLTVMAGQQIIATKPFEGQKPGTSGLRKRVNVFQQEHYTENFVQSILSAIPSGAKGATLVVGGDGRFFSQPAVQKIVRLAAGNGVAKLILSLIHI